MSTCCGDRAHTIKTLRSAILTFEKNIHRKHNFSDFYSNSRAQEHIKMISYGERFITVKLK